MIQVIIMHGGDTETKNTFNKHTYKFYGQTGVSKYNDTDNLKELQKDDDAAAQYLFKQYSMPTLDQLKELFMYTKKTFNDKNKVLILTSLYNKNELIIPLSGRKNFMGLGTTKNIQYRFWTKTLDEYIEGQAYSAKIINGNSNIFISSISRSLGLPIRPVLNK